jgi:nucleoside-diphosphate-sugar epimerase
MAQRGKPPALKGVHKVLVTGATGFIGRHLVAQLEKMGKQVVCASRATGFDVTRDRLPLKGVTHVFHLAARIGVEEAWRVPIDYLNTNALGTARVIDQCRGRCSMTFVSAYVYGNPRRLTIRESDPVDVQNPYALSKLLGEQICAFYARFYEVPIVALRPFNIYGPGQDSRLVIPHIVEQFLDSRRRVVLVKDLAPSRDYVYISDAIEGIILASQVASGSVFNIGSGTTYTVEEIITRVSKISGIRKPYHATGRKRPREIDRTCADITAFRKAVGWRPEISIDTGLRLVIESMRR